MPEGDYNGMVTTGGSSLADDNKTVGVIMHVTSQPIAQVTPASLMIRLAQDVPPQSYDLTFSNAGLGTLTLNGTFVNTGPDLGSGWLSALNTGLTVTVSIDPSGLSPGVYQATLTVNTNAANGQLAIPVSLQIVPQGAPVVTFQGVRDSVLLGTDPLAQGEIATVLGEQFTFGGSATGVSVNDVPAPVISTSYGQIGFQVPYETAPGTATLRVTRDDQVSNPVSFSVVDRAPRLMRLGATDYGYIVNQDGSNPVPANSSSVAGHPAHPGDMLMIFGIGFGLTDPLVASGAAAPSDEPLARLANTPNVTFGGGFSGTAETVQPVFSGLAPGLVGVYRLDVTLPDDVQTGPAVPVTVDIEGHPSNTVRVAIDPAPQESGAGFGQAKPAVSAK
jgi:uncharacterized protein (TIGR03437 family)